MDMGVSDSILSGLPMKTRGSKNVGTKTDSKLGSTVSSVSSLAGSVGREVSPAQEEQATFPSPENSNREKENPFGTVSTTSILSGHPHRAWEATSGIATRARSTRSDESRRLISVIKIAPRLKTGAMRRTPLLTGSVGRSGSVSR